MEDKKSVLTKFDDEGKVPNEVVRFNDGRMAPKNETVIYSIVQKLFIFFVVGLILGSIFFDDFTLDESAGTWICVFITWGYLVKKGGHARIECPSELQFYNDYMIFYVPKHHIKRGKEQMEVQKMYYSAVKECTYRVYTRKMCIFGYVDETYYKYDKNGNMQNQPCFHKYYDGMIKFYTVFDERIDFKSIIEKNTPLKVTMKTLQ